MDSICLVATNAGEREKGKRMKERERKREEREREERERERRAQFGAPDDVILKSLEWE